ncbi:hypothetical protein D9M70_206510 [compost metagenome]
MMMALASTPHGPFREAVLSPDRGKGWASGGKQACGTKGRTLATGKKNPASGAGLRYERGVLANSKGYSSMVRISASTSPRRLVKRAAAAPLITRWS